MTRKQLINLIRVAGAEGDVGRGTDLYICNRISREAYDKAFREGLAIKNKLNGRDIKTTTYSDIMGL